MPAHVNKPRSGETPLLNGHSPVKAAALAMLLESPGHGYEIAQRINQRMGVAWNLREKQIYSALRQLEEAGLARSGEEPSSRKANMSRIVFYPTELAEPALSEWFAGAPVRSTIRADIDARIAFASEEQLPELLRSLDAYRLDLLKEIEDNAVFAVPNIPGWLARKMRMTQLTVERRRKSEIDLIGELKREIEEEIAERAAR